jgi:hypothetical protein
LKSSARIRASFVFPDLTSPSTAIYFRSVI